MCIRLQVKSKLRDGVVYVPIHLFVTVNIITRLELPTLGAFYIMKQKFVVFRRL